MVPKEAYTLLPTNLEDIEVPEEIDFETIFEKHMATGHSNSHARFLEQVYGSNHRIVPQPSFYKTLQGLFQALNCSGSTINDSDNIVDLTPTGHHNLQKEKLNQIELRYDLPILKILRKGKFQNLTMMDLVVGDIFQLKHKQSFLRETPCDMILIEGKIKVSSYLEIFDQEHQEMFDYNNSKLELPPGAYHKEASSLNDIDEPMEDCLFFDNMIMNSKRFIPKGVRILSGECKALCIRTGNNTVKGLFRFV
jgi:hypothetical protein